MGLSAAAETYMLTDETPDLSDTRAFVSRRLEELASVSSASHGGASVAATATTAASAAVSTLFDVLVRPNIIAKDGKGLSECIQPLAAFAEKMIHDMNKTRSR